MRFAGIATLHFHLPCKSWQNAFPPNTFILLLRIIWANRLGKHTKSLLIKKGKLLNIVYFLLYHFNNITRMLEIIDLTHGMIVYKDESSSFMKGQFKISVIYFGLNSVLWKGCIFRIIPVHRYFSFEFAERL